jgi:hypothetical protein
MLGQAIYPSYFFTRVNASLTQLYSMGKNTFLFYHSILLGFVFVQLSLNTSTAQIKPLDLPDGWEVWYDKVPVSGGFRVGLIDDYMDTPLDKPFFHVQIPEHEEKLLCVLVSSRDGRYKAELTYDISGLSEGRYAFEWPTLYFNKLKQFTAQDLTILCSVGNSCDQDAAYYAYASWNDSTQSDTLFLLVNSDRPPRVVVEDEGGSEKSKAIDCERINVRAGIAYNCLCKIPKNLVRPASQLFVVKRVRRLGRTSFIRYPLPLKPPKP